MERIALRPPAQITKLKIWIGNTATDLGTYHWWEVYYPTNSTIRIILTRHHFQGDQEHLFDPNTTPIFIEHSPSKERLNPDRFMPISPNDVLQVLPGNIRTYEN